MPPKSTAAAPNTILGLGGSGGPQQRRVNKDGKPLPTPEEARRIAIFHARQIELRKKTELAILESIEALIDIPTHLSSDVTASTPMQEDVEVFKFHLRHFRPADYDEVIRERNIVNKCGYPLCPLPNKRVPGASKLRFVDGGRKVVEQAALERFCGDACARRALWIRVQLSEEPAWVRVGITEDNLDENTLRESILLLEEQEAIRKGKYQGGRIDAEVEMSRLQKELDDLGIKPTPNKSGPKVEIAESTTQQPRSQDVVEEETATRSSLAREEAAKRAEIEAAKKEQQEKKEAPKPTFEPIVTGFELSKEEEELIEQYQRQMELKIT